MLYSYIFLLVLLILFEITRYRRYKIDFLTIFNIYFLLYYLLPPLVFILYPHDSWKYLYKYPQSVDSLLLFIVVFLSFIIVNTVYIYFNRGNSIYRIVEKPNLKKLLIYVFVISILIVYIRAMSYGGIVNFMTLGHLIRMGEISGGIINYLILIQNLIAPVTIIYLSLYLLNRKVKYLTIFIISFIFFLILSLSTGGRSSLILSILPLLFVYLNSRKINLSFILIALSTIIIVFSIVIYGRSFMFALSMSNLNIDNFIETYLENQIKYESGVENIFINILRQFDFVYVSTYYILENFDKYGGYRFFLDYPRIIIDILPGVSLSNGDLDIFNIKTSPASINRDLIGFHEGYVPVGWIGLSLLNGGVFWLIIISFFGGYIGAKINNIIYFSNIEIKSGFYIFMAFLWLNVIFHSDPLDLLIPRFSDYIFFINLNS